MYVKAYRTFDSATLAPVRVEIVTVGSARAYSPIIEDVSGSLQRNYSIVYFTITVELSMIFPVTSEAAAA